METSNILAYAKSLVVTMAAFVGREQDLETVGRYFQEALQGKGAVVFITGEAGIGKTTFINEFKARYVDARNAASKNKKAPEIRFAEAKCSELIGKGEAYAPFVDLIGRLVSEDKAFGSSRLAEVVEEIGADWFELVPVIGKALKLVSKTLFKWQSADDARQLADRKGNKEKLVQQYVQILKIMSEKHPLVLFVDDLHWADDSSIYLLFQLAREIQDRRILLLGTYRPTDIQAVRGEKAHPLKDALGEMHRFGVCKEVKLGYFTPDHIRRYLDATFPQNRLDAEFVAYLRDLTEGNPLFVTEQVKLLQEIGKIAPAPQTSQVSETCEVSPVWELRGTLRDADMPIPTSVEKTIEKRFERLKEEMQETLQYASVSGESFDSAVLAQMLQRDELALLKQLQTLDRVYEFVREQKTGDRPTRGAVYQFIHSLVQKSLYATLSDGIKVKLHAKAAEIIETLYSEQREAFAEELAAHWERGREYAKAAPYLLLSARKANRHSGYQEAKAHAQRGLEILKSAGFPTVETRDGRTPHVETRGRASLPKTPDQAMLRLQIELLLELATAEEAIGEAKNSIDHAEIAAKLVKMMNDQSFQGDVFFQIGNLLLLNKTNFERILDVLEKSLALKIEMKDCEGCIKILEKIREPLWECGKGDVFMEHCQKIISLNQQTQKVFLNVTLFELISIMLYAQGKHQEAYNTIIEGLNIVLTPDNSHVQIGLLEHAVNYAILLNNIVKAAEHYKYAKAIADKAIVPEIKRDIFYKLGLIAWRLSKYDESLNYFQIAREEFQRCHNLEMEGMILSAMMSRCKDIGRFDTAIQYGMAYLGVMKKLGRVEGILKALDSLGTIYKYYGNHAKALETHQQGVELSRKYGRENTLSSFLSSSHTELKMLGRFREALKAVSEQVSICRQLNTLNGQAGSLSGLAICHFCLGHFQEAQSIMQESLTIHKTTPNKPLFIALPLRYSQILLGIGHYKEAYPILDILVNDAMGREEWYGDIHISMMDSVRIYIEFDEMDKAVNRLLKIREFLKNHFFMEATAMLKETCTQVYLAQGDLEKAESSLNEAIALFQQMNSYRLGEADLTLAALRLAQGQPAAALEAASAARNIFTEIEYYRAGEAILWEAKALFALRRFPDAQTRLKESAAEFKRLQQPHHLAEAQLLHGQMLAAAGQPEKALQNMISAKKTFVKLGLKRLENEAERVISRMKK